MKTLWLSGPHWLAILRIGLGLWWLESWRHKDKQAWFKRGTGIAWAKSIAEKHRFKFINRTFERFVEPHSKLMAYVIVYAELSIGIGVAFGFLTPVALIGGLLLNITYFVLMIHDWAEQGQNLMMILVSFICLVMQANQAWSIDHVLHILGA